jgi:hypothetical protein
MCSGECGHQVALVAVTTEIALGVSMPTIGATELLELLELPALMLELLLPLKPLAAELDELLSLEDPPQALSVSVMASANPPTRGRVIRVMRISTDLLM